jgi:hypothetical protein
LGSQPCQMNWISRVSETVTGSSNPWWWWWYDDIVSKMLRHIANGPRFHCIYWLWKLQISSTVFKPELFYLESFISHNSLSKYVPVTAWQWHQLLASSHPTQRMICWQFNLISKVGSTVPALDRLSMEQWWNGIGWGKDKCSETIRPIYYLWKLSSSFHE